jgi:hypothetical protein
LKAPKISNLSYAALVALTAFGTGARCLPPMAPKDSVTLALLSSLAFPFSKFDMESAILPWIYAPTSRMTIDDPRNEIKVEYIDALTAHTANVRRDTGVKPFLSGDFNIARHTVDCSLHIDEGKRPSTYPKECCL